MVNDSLKEIRTQKKSISEQPCVSVAMIAYNVGKFLEEAIESVLNQKTDFKVELVIGEDCSPDDTKKIALNYQKQYPDIVRVLLPEKNQGLTPNSVATQNACRGKYIALCDGDDYWTDSLKLQKQINFLDNNSDYSATGHQATVVYDDQSAESHNFGSNSDADYGIQDTITHRKFHTSSLVYRKEFWDKVGGIPTTILSNERAIYPMLAIFGKIKYFKEPMCIYRKSSFGISSRITAQELEMDLNMIPWLRRINKDFPTIKFRSFLHLCIYTYPANVSFVMLIKHYLQFASLSFSYFPKNLGDIKYGTSKFFNKLLGLK